MSFQMSQAIIVAAIVAFCVYVFRLRTELGDRLIYIALVLGGMAFAFNPALSTRIANAIGIGRGTDLIVYAFVILSLFRQVSMSVQHKRFERQITALVRELALARALRGSPPSEAELPRVKDVV